MEGQPNIEVEVREATGLTLGTFDLYVVRQKIYEGELSPTCEFKDPSGNWQALGSRTEFADIFWLRGISTDDLKTRKRAAFGGWQSKGKAKEQPAAESEIAEVGQGSEGRLRNLTKRLKLSGLPKGEAE